MFELDEINDSNLLWQRIGVFNLPNKRRYSRFSRNLSEEELLDQTHNVDFTVNEEIKNRLLSFIDNNFWFDIVKVGFELPPDYTNVIPSSNAYDFAQIFIAQRNSIGTADIDEEKELKIHAVSNFMDFKEIAAIYVTSYLEEFQFSIILLSKNADEKLLSEAFDRELFLHDLFPNMFFSFRYIPKSLVCEDECVLGSSELIFEKEDV